MPLFGRRWWGCDSSLSFLDFFFLGLRNWTSSARSFVARRDLSRPTSGLTVEVSDDEDNRRCVA